MKKTSLEELSAVSTESWITPIIKPIVTICIATSFCMPSKEQARGISNSDPPAIPDVPQAPRVETTHKSRAVAKSTSMPKDLAAQSDITAIVIAAPSIFIVAPSGIETE